MIKPDINEVSKLVIDMLEEDTAFAFMAEKVPCHLLITWTQAAIARYLEDVCQDGPDGGAKSQFDRAQLWRDSTR